MSYSFIPGASGLGAGGVYTSASFSFGAKGSGGSTVSTRTGGSLVDASPSPMPASQVPAAAPAPAYRPDVPAWYPTKTPTPTPAPAPRTDIYKMASSSVPKLSTPSAAVAPTKSDYQAAAQAQMQQAAKLNWLPWVLGVAGIGLVVYLTR